MGGRNGPAPAATIAGLSALGFAGLLAGPPIIGLAAELLGLRGALMLVGLAGVIVTALSGALRERAPAPAPAD